MADNTEVADETRVYVEVFGIPQADCPPDYFVLLGLGSECAESAQIEAAAKKRESLLNKSLPSELHLPARKVLRRMERAKVCLLDPHSRAAYLAKLSGGLSGSVFIPSGDDLASLIDLEIPLLSENASDAGISRKSIPALRAATGATNKVAQRPTAIAPREKILDLGPSTVLKTSGTKSSDMIGPLVTLAGVVGVLVVGLLVYGLSGGNVVHQIVA